MIHNLILLETINIAFSNSSDSLWKTIVPIIAALITAAATIVSAWIAIRGVRRTINSNQELKNQELLNSLDQKSEWRKELMNIASKTFLTTDDIYRVLASLRYLPKRPIEMERENKAFNTISNYIYFRLKELKSAYYYNLLCATSL